MLLEYLSQFYRTLIPTPLWFGFCSNYSDTGAVFAIIITASYLMIKGAVILARGRELLKAICTFIRDKVIKTDFLMYHFPYYNLNHLHRHCLHNLILRDNYLLLVST